MRPRELTARVAADEEGATAIVTALMLSAVLAFVALGLEVTSSVQEQHRLQDAADNAASGAMVALRAGEDPVAAAAMLLARNGVTAAPDLSVEISSPPAAGQWAGDPRAIHIRLRSDRWLKLMSLVGADGADAPVAAESTARVSADRQACVLALSAGPSPTITANNPSNLRLVDCEAFSVDSGFTPTRLAAADPWYRLALPPVSGCNASGLTVTGTKSVAAGASPYSFCGGLRVRSGGKLTLGPGVYAVSGKLTIDSGGKISGSGVTVILRPGSTATFSPGSHVDLSAPLTGTTAGLVIASDLSGGAATSTLRGGPNQYLVGAVHLPRQKLRLQSLTSSACTHFIADTIDVTGPARVSNLCAGTAIRPIEDLGVRLVG